MAVERIAPDALLEQVNLTGSLTDIDEDPDSPDGLWLEEVDDGEDTICRTSFGTPSGNPEVGADLQDFRLWVRRSTTAGGNDPTLDVGLYENGVLVSWLQTGISITSTTGQLVSVTWNASLLGTPDGSLVELRAIGQRSGGSPGSRRTVEFGAVEWDCDVSSGTIFNESLTEDFTVADVPSVVTEFATPLVEAFQFADVPAAVMEWITPLVEGLSLGDVVAADVFGRARVSWAELRVPGATTGQTFNESLTENVSFGDTLACVLEVVASVAENLGIADIKSVVLEAVPTLTEGFSFNDVVGGTLEIAKSLTEGVAFSDLPTPSVEIAKSIVEALGLGDQPSTVLELTGVLTEGMSVGDTVSTILEMVVQLSEDFTLGDLPAVLSPIFNEQLTESVLLGDVMLGLLEILSGPTDDVGFSDVVEATVVFVGTLLVYEIDSTFPTDIQLVAELSSDVEVSGSLGGDVVLPVGMSGDVELEGDLPADLVLHTAILN
jgi:hypothetical protein